MFFHKSYPISQQWLNRLFISTIVILALIAGYFFTETQRLAAKCWQEPDAKSVMNSLLNEKR